MLNVSASVNVSSRLQLAVQGGRAGRGVTGGARIGREVARNVVTASIGANGTERGGGVRSTHVSPPVERRLGGRIRGEGVAVRGGLLNWRGLYHGYTLWDVDGGLY